MPKLKATDKNIAEAYDLTPQSLRNWKKSDDEKLVRRYNALKASFERDNGLLLDFTFKDASTSIVSINDVKEQIEANADTIETISIREG